MTAEDARLLLQAVNLAVSIGVGLYVWQSSRHRVTNERISTLAENIDKRLDSHESRLTRAETEISTAPTHKDLGAMHEKINSVSISVSRIEGLIKGIGDQVTMVLSRIAERGMR